MLLYEPLAKAVYGLLIVTHFEMHCQKNNWFSFYRAIFEYRRH